MAVVEFGIFHEFERPAGVSETEAFDHAFDLAWNRYRLAAGVLARDQDRVVAVRPLRAFAIAAVPGETLRTGIHREGAGIGGLPVRALDGDGRAHRFGHVEAPGRLTSGERRRGSVDCHGRPDESQRGGGLRRFFDRDQGRELVVLSARSVFVTDDRVRSRVARSVTGGVV